MNEHTSKKFDAELEGIRTRVLQMGGMVELQIVKAMEGLTGGDLLLIDQVIENDNRVNNIYCGETRRLWWVREKVLCPNSWKRFN